MQGLVNLCDASAVAIDKDTGGNGATDGENKGGPPPSSEQTPGAPPPPWSPGRQGSPQEQQRQIQFKDLFLGGLAAPETISCGCSSHGSLDDPDVTPLRCGGTRSSGSGSRRRASSGSAVPPSTSPSVQRLRRVLLGTASVARAHDGHDAGRTFAKRLENFGGVGWEQLKWRRGVRR